MTPLVARTLRDLTLAKSQRTFQDVADVLATLSSAHCFECSEIIEAATDIAVQSWEGLFSKHRDTRKGIFAASTFLPSPLTVIEYRGANGGPREAHVLKEQCDGWCDWRVILEGPFRSAALGGLSLSAFVSDDHAIGVDPSPAILRMIDANIDGKAAGFFLSTAGKLRSLLAMINAPRIIGRRQHMPHAGLQRKIARSKGMVGKFPLRAWTEIVLEVSPPKEAVGEYEARLSGAKALHFCRAHLRVRNGQLEYVRAHWRGDPALGIKRSRYRLTHPCPKSAVATHG